METHKQFPSLAVYVTHAFRLLAMGTRAKGSLDNDNKNAFRLISSHRRSALSDSTVMRPSLDLRRKV